MTPASADVTLASRTDSSGRTGFSNRAWSIRGLRDSQGFGVDGLGAEPRFIIPANAPNQANPMTPDQTDIHHYQGSSYRIDFQEGPVGEAGENGCQNEDIIEVLLHRLRGLQDRLSCRENALAITKLEEALMWLEKRTSRRVAQGVEGTEKRHRRE